MARKIKRHGNIAIAGKRDGKGLHQLLRSRKAVRDDNNRRGGVDLRLKDAGRDGTNLHIARHKTIDRLMKLKYG